MDVANTIAVLYATSGGRPVVSFGRGDGGFAQIGRKPMTVAAFETYVTEMQSYLRKQVLTRVPTTDPQEGNAARLADTVLPRLA
jgi:hypothetical protein